MSRNTRQGEVLRATIQAAERPLTPREIHFRATQKIPGLGLATSYRHIQSMTEEGSLVGIDYPGQPTRYEWADGRQKIHFSCRSCDKLFALDEEPDFREPDSPALPVGFKATGGEWILYGHCAVCSEKEGSQ